MKENTKQSAREEIRDGNSCDSTDTAVEDNTLDFSRLPESPKEENDANSTGEWKSKMDEDSKPSPSMSIVSSETSSVLSNKSDVEFNVGQRIEVKDYRTEMWYMAKIMEVDYDDREIFIHYERWSQRFDEWLKWDSQRIRKIRSPPTSSKFKIGDNVLATWNYTKKYPAIVKNVLPNDKYEVLFFDGFLKIIKGNRITKLNSNSAEIMSKLPNEVPRAPPIGADLDVRNIGTKEDRRLAKRRLNVVELLQPGKKRKPDGECHSPQQAADVNLEQPVPSPTVSVQKRKYQRRGGPGARKQKEEVVEEEEEEAVGGGGQESSRKKRKGGAVGGPSKKRQRRRKKVTSEEEELADKGKAGEGGDREEDEPPRQRNQKLAAGIGGEGKTNQKYEPDRVQNESTTKAKMTQSGKEKSPIDCNVKSTASSPHASVAGIKQRQKVEIESESSTDHCFAGFAEESQNEKKPPKAAAAHRSPLIIKDVTLKDLLPNINVRRISKRGRVPKLKTSLGAVSTSRSSATASAFPKIKPRRIYNKSSERKLPRSRGRRLKRQTKISPDPLLSADVVDKRSGEDSEMTPGRDHLPSSISAVERDAAARRVESQHRRPVQGDKLAVEPVAPTVKAELMNEELQTLLSNTESELRENSPSSVEPEQPKTPGEVDGALSESYVDPVTDTLNPEVATGEGLPSAKKKGKRMRKTPKQKQQQNSSETDEIKKGWKFVSRRKGDEEDDPERWNGDVPEGAKPVFIDGGEGKIRQSIIIPDNKLPQGWSKHTIIRKNSSKWDVLLVNSPSPNKKKNSEGKKQTGEDALGGVLSPQTPPAAPQEEKRVKTLMPKTKPPAPLPLALPLAEDDGIAPLPVAQSPLTTSSSSSSAPISTPVKSSAPLALMTPKSVSSRDAIPLGVGGGPSTPTTAMPDGDSTGSCQCPKQGCGKNFRKENLLQMHIKHYHPEYNKFLDCALNVADLAYARTVGEPLDETIGAMSFLERISKYEAKRKERAEFPRKKSGSGVQHSPLRKALLKGMSGKDSPEHNEEFGDASGKLVGPQLSGLQSVLRIRADGSESDTGDGDSETPLPRSAIGHNVSDRHRMLTEDDNDGRLVHQLSKDSALGTLTPPPSATRLRGCSLSDDMMPESPATPSAPSVPGSSVNPTNTSYRYARKKPYVAIEKLNVTTDSNDSIVDHADQDLSTEMSNCAEIEGVGDLLKKEEIINCMCGYPEEDGLMIQCDLCLCWQHGLCNNIEHESEVPEKYVCYICQHPRHLRISHKYNHNQEWLKEGTLPSLSFGRQRSPCGVEQREALLKRSHGLIATLLQLQKVVHSLRLKIHIAGKSDHPKLYLWAKSWVKEGKTDVKIKEEDVVDDKKLTTAAEAEAKTPQAPVPEAPIDLVECRLRLLEHIEDFQQQIDSRLTSLEAQVVALESEDPDLASDETADFYPQTKQTMQMLLRDLMTLRKVASLN